VPPLRRQAVKVDAVVRDGDGPVAAYAGSLVELAAIWLCVVRLYYPTLADVPYRPLMRTRIIALFFVYLLARILTGPLRRTRHLRPSRSNGRIRLCVVGDPYDL